MAKHGSPLKAAKKVLRPHHDQDGWVYVRVLRCRLVDYLGKFTSYFGGSECMFEYQDDFRGSRIITSRRVEEAVEVNDYLKKCYNSEFFVSYYENRWCVSDYRTGITTASDSLREAYHRLIAKNNEYYDNVASIKAGLEDSLSEEVMTLAAQYPEVFHPADAVGSER